MTAQKKSLGKLVGTVGELEHGTSKKFTMRRGGRALEALLVNYQGNHFAYVNRCRHMPTPLDFMRNQFVSEDGRYLQCYTHGALYEFGTGQCIAGPCKGERLYRLPVRLDRGEVLVGCPQGDLRPMGE